MKNKKHNFKKIARGSRHTCKWCGACRYKSFLKKIKNKSGFYWVCKNGDECAQKAAQYKRPKVALNDWPDSCDYID